MAKTKHKPKASNAGKPSQEMEVAVFFEIGDVPVSEEELDLLECHLGDLIDEMLKQ